VVPKGLSFTSHPSEDLLEEYAFQRLAEEHVAPLEEHLLACSSCQEALAEIDEYLLLMKRGTAQTAVSPAREPRGLWWPIWTPSRMPNLARAFATKWAHNWAWTAAGALACLAAAILLSHRPVPVAPVSIALVALRGGETNTAPRGAPLELQLEPGDSSSPADYRIEIVSAAGKRVWSGEAKLKPPASGGGLANGKLEAAKLEADVTPGLGKGLYWVRLYEAEKLRSETGLLVQ
jgi:hypothetical protein